MKRRDALSVLGCGFLTVSRKTIAEPLDNDEVTNDIQMFCVGPFLLGDLFGTNAKTRKLGLPFQIGAAPENKQLVRELNDSKLFVIDCSAKSKQHGRSFSAKEYPLVVVGGRLSYEFKDNNSVFVVNVASLSVTVNSDDYTGKTSSRRVILEVGLDIVGTKDAVSASLIHKMTFDTIKYSIDGSIIKH